MATTMAHVTPADARCAQAALDSLVEVLEGREDGSWLAATALLELRGLLAAQMADVRHAGFLEGEQHGRRLIGHAVLDALEAEGISTTSTRQGDGL